MYNLERNYYMTAKKKIFVTIFTIILSIVILGLLGIFFLPNTWDNTKDTQVLIIQNDETGSDITNALYEKGLIRSPLAFRLALRLSGDTHKLQTGYYQIPAHINVYDLIHLLQKGRVKSVHITIPEGYTIGEIAIELEKKQIVSAKDFLEAAKDYMPYSYMNSTKPVTYRVEGFLFPSTYDIPVNSSARDILKIMSSEMNDYFTNDVKEQLKKDHMTIFEFVTLASLVEKEARFDEDRATIAAVFKKRIQEGVPLQSDATIAYVLGYPKAHITLADTKLQSPYNTYVVKGYPPGPIANPGKKSMDAVLYAPPTDYLYFVADKEGHNHFSKTYEEHLKVVDSIYGNDGDSE